LAAYKKEFTIDERPMCIEKWYVCYQDKGKDMTCKNLKNEKEAKEMYDKYKGNKAASTLFKNAQVVEEDGDK